MNKIYETEQLKKLQEYELEIVEDFTKVCRENNLTYIGIAGTCLGAVRHKGFIPWDDDVDVAMPYEDYLKLNAIFEEKFKDKYTVVNAQKYNDYPAINEHIVINGTKFVTEDAKHLKYPQGIFLDVFPLYKSPKDEVLRKKHYKKAWILGKILILREIPFPKVPFTGLKRKAVHIATFCISKIIRLLISHKNLYSIILKLSLKYQNEEDYIYEYYSDPKPGRMYFYKDDFFPIKELPFENTTLNFPNNTDVHLRRNYGNYMQLPPVEKRRNHAPLVLKFYENDNF